MKKYLSLKKIWILFQNSETDDDVLIPFEYDTTTGFNPGLFLENYFSLLSNDSEFCFQKPKRKSGFKIHNPSIRYYFEGDKLGKNSLLEMMPKLSIALGITNRITNNMVKPNRIKRMLEFEESSSDSSLNMLPKKSKMAVIKEET